MKPFTRRLNGRSMTTLSVKFHVGSVEMTEILCGYGGSSRWDWHPDVWVDDYTPGTELTRAQVEACIRKALRDYGTEAHDCVGGFNDSGNFNAQQALAIVRWAASQVRRLYPELADPALDDYVAGYEQDAAGADEEEGDD